MIQLTKEEEQKIEAEALKAYPEVDFDPQFKNYWETQSRIRRYEIKAYIAAATSRQLRIKELEEALEKISVDHYPESVFKPMTEGEWSEVVRYIQRKYNIDAISGYYGRFFHKIHRDIAQQALNYKP